MGQKFCRNRSVSYGFRDINIFCFSAKIQDGRQKWRKLKFSIAHRILYHYHASQNFCQNGSISYGFRDINIFLFFRKNSRWPPKVAKIEIFQFCIEYFPTTLRVKNSVEIALSLTVSEILTFFVFPQKFKMAAKSGEN